MGPYAIFWSYQKSKSSNPRHSLTSEIYGAETSEANLWRQTMIWIWWCGFSITSKNGIGSNHHQHLPLLKVSFLLHQIAIFISSPYTSFICSCSHCCCIIFFNYRIYMYKHAMLTLINQCLLNVVFSIAKTLNGQISLKQHFYYLHLSTLFGNLCFSECLFFSFSHSSFYFKPYKILTDPTPVGNKSDKTPYLMP